MTAEYLPLYQTLLGGAISLASSLGAIYLSKRIETRTAASQLAQAFKGEISALLRIVRTRDYVSFFKSELVRLRSPQPQISAIVINVRQEYRLVYLENVSKLGALRGDLPIRISTLYTLIASLLEDFATFKEWASPGCMPTDPKVVEFAYQSVLLMLEETIAMADEAVGQIDRLHPS